GGAGVHWNGQTWRFHPRDFTAYTSTVERYGKSFMPPDMQLQDWGITYDQLEPYFDKFEYMAGIAGKAGNIKGQKIPGGNVFEGPRSREYPVRPQSQTQSTSMFNAAALELGHHPFPAPSANLPVSYKNRDGRRRSQLRLSDGRRRRDRVVHRQEVQALHGVGRAVVRPRRLQRGQLRPQCARVHRRRLDLVGPGRCEADPEPHDAAGHRPVRP